jgi:F420-dependent oxidoreductase-like protein
LTKPKFGVFLPFYAFQAKNQDEQFRILKTIILECERLGYDSVWLDDHLMYKDWAILETWTTLSALSTLTSRIRLGTMVSCIIHRNPALLAKIAATLDVLSNGRLEFGIGAGVQETEHIAYGFGFPNTKIRAEMLTEALEVITSLWTGNKTSYKGKYYALNEAICKPKPNQNPRPPIIVGGSGEKFTLKITAKYADRFDWGYIPSIDNYKHKLEVLERNCHSVGRDFGEIERSCWLGGQILMGKDKTDLSKKISQYKPPNLSREEFKTTTLTGTLEDISKHLQVYLNLDVSYFMLYLADLPSLDGLRLFSQAILGKN